MDVKAHARKLCSIVMWRAIIMRKIISTQHFSGSSICYFRRSWKFVRVSLPSTKDRGIEVNLNSIIKLKCLTKLSSFSLEKAIKLCVMYISFFHVKFILHLIPDKWSTMSKVKFVTKHNQDESVLKVICIKIAKFHFSMQLCSYYHWIMGSLVVPIKKDSARVQLIS